MGSVVLTGMLWGFELELTTVITKPIAFTGTVGENVSRNKDVRQFSVMYHSLCPFHSLYHGLYVSHPSHSFPSHYLFSHYSVLWSFHPLPVLCSALHSILTIFVLPLGTLQVTFQLSTVMPIILTTSIIPCPVYPSGFDPLVSPLSWHYLIGFAIVALSWIVLKPLILVVSFPSLLST